MSFEINTSTAFLRLFLVVLSAVAVWPCSERRRPVALAPKAAPVARPVKAVNNKCTIAMIQVNIQHLELSP